ncbi:MAG: cysteine--tRNA ligase [Thermoplasmata archaeon]
MALTVYNSLAKKKEEFIPVRGEGAKDVGMYVCGPTVYDNVHIGHARAFVSFDVIRRYLEFKGYRVKYVMNFTDVDDKIIRRAAEKGVPALELSSHYIQEFFEDTKGLNLKKADANPTPSTHIPEIIHIIKILVEKGFAYESEGDVYFRVNRVERFGVLSGQTLDELKVGARIDPSEKKENPMDFALWKAAKPGEVFWDSPWGKGRPGWHIECSAMSIKYLGEQFDIHGGGNDLIFPHHECEIMQSEAYTGKSPFVKYWLHNGFVTINSEKMSKSLGNFFTLKDVLKLYSPLVLRFFLIHTHYRGPLDYSDSALGEAKEAYERLYNTLQTLIAYSKMIAPGKDKEIMNNSVSDRCIAEAIAKTKEEFIKAMDDDFNTRDAIASLFELSRLLNRAANERTMSIEDTQSAILLFRDLGEGVLGLFPAVFGTKEDSALVDRLVKLLIDLRQDARKKKDFKTADTIRDSLKDIGIILEDSKDGTVWKMK